MLQKPGHSQHEMMMWRRNIEQRQVCKEEWGKTEQCDTQFFNTTISDLPFCLIESSLLER